MNQKLDQELKELIVSALDLEDIKPADIDSEAPLFGKGLGLDSVDALELGLRISKKYNIKINAKSKENKEHFASVKSLALFIESQQNSHQEPSPV
jgi:acyl carrier protein